MKKLTGRTKLHKGPMASCPHCKLQTIGLEECFRLIYKKGSK